jgi:DnaJ-class molecular chaperone
MPNRARKTLYDLLQVAPSATPDVIRAAYRALAHTYHPDRNADADAAAVMCELNAAYEVLSDPRRRVRYDARLQRLGQQRGASVELRRVSHGSRLRALLAALAILALVGALLLLLWAAYDAAGA